MELQEVVITKQDTCLTYAFKRAGIFTSINDTEDLEKEFELIPFDYYKLKIGAVLVWENSNNFADYPYGISKSGDLIFKRVYFRYHLGVLEDLDFLTVSDLTRTETKNGHPIVRLRLLTDVTLPKYILKKKENI